MFRRGKTGIGVKNRVADHSDHQGGAKREEPDLIRDLGGGGVTPS